jgi:hypothetical protein
MPFVILALPRTGSTHLTTLLHRQDGIVCHGEIFNPRRESFLGRWPKSKQTPELIAELTRLRRDEPERFLEHLFAEDDGGCAVGFKIFRGHNRRVLEIVLAAPTVNKIVLFRRNVLASYSSSLIAKLTGQHAVREHVPTQTVVTFDGAEFTQYWQRYMAFYGSIIDRLNATRQRFFLMHYDEINDPSLFSALLCFIGVEPPTARRSGRIVKQNSPEILKRFSNPEAAAAFLTDRNLMGWAYEPETVLAPLEGITSDTEGSNEEQLVDFEDDQ